VANGCWDGSKSKKKVSSTKEKLGEEGRLRQILETGTPNGGVWTYEANREKVHLGGGAGLWGKKEWDGGKEKERKGQGKRREG